MVYVVGFTVICTDNLGPTKVVTVVDTELDVTVALPFRADAVDVFVTDPLETSDAVTARVPVQTRVPPGAIADVSAHVTVTLSSATAGKVKETLPLLVNVYV